MNNDWKTKPSDRFILRWIKLTLSAPVTVHLAGIPWLRPWMITLCATSIGVLAGAVFALGAGFAAGCLAACAQVLDGVDGQFSRLTGTQSKGGAFLDSVLDRYSDAALMIGMSVYLFTLPAAIPTWLLLLLAYLALCGGSLVSYSTARAESLGIDTGSPTLASKGTRTSVMVLCGWASAIWPAIPLLGLFYLSVHPNSVILRRLIAAHKVNQPI
ncbi:MAG: CDP-alcohol phosphatidyltransferase family protein [Desulfobacteraceae bacterium]|nr:CDP-alcohol phosphatidyltransferase family protein [Desulfobacteraceae bacterium]